MIELNLNPTRNELRNFGLAALAFSAIVATIVFRRTGSTSAAATIVSVGVIVAVLGFVLPKAIRPVFVVMTIVGYPIGWVMTHAIMGVIFYLVVTPVGVIMRLCGRDPMERGFDRRAASYWKPRRTDSDSRRYFRQF
jgi:hypothetical protein